MRRWLLWTFRCWRGRRCAHVAFDAIDAEIEIDGEPFTGVATVGYVCDVCCTAYERQAIVGAEGAFTQLDPVRT